jgi:hypothetical protein
VAADLVSIIDPLMYMYQYDDHLYGTEGVKKFLFITADERDMVAHNI